MSNTPIAPPPPRQFTFVAGQNGAWQIDELRCLAGEPLAAASSISVVAGNPKPSNDAVWQLRGVTSNERYVMQFEKTQLVSKQEGLGRAGATRGALIPIRKKAAWWTLAQDERREVFEAQSKHIAIGMKYLPAIARKLFHCRDLSADEPFDFLTWFEFAPSDVSAFDDLLAALRASPEWAYVEREADIRLVR